MLRCAIITYMKIKIILFFYIILICILAGCSAGLPEPTPAPESTPEPTPIPFPAGLWVGDYIIESHQDSLGLLSITTITGNLIIDGTNLDEIDNLSTIITIEGDIIISHINQLSTLAVLENLVSANSIQIYNCNSLVSFAGFTQLQELGKPYVRDTIILENNPELQDISGFSHLSICAGITIDACNKLADLTPLQNTTTTTDPFYYFPLTLTNNTSLVSLDGLNSLNGYIGTILIENNPILTDITALQNITGCASLTIRNNAALPNLDGFSGIHDKDIKELFLINNSSLENVDGLSNITYIRKLYLEACPPMCDFSGLNSAHQIDEVYIENNQFENGLVNAAFNRVHLIHIINNPLLNNLDFLQSFIMNLDTPTRSIRIEENASLSDIDGLQALQELTSLDLLNNPNIITLPVLSDSITSLQSLCVENNGLLSSIPFLANLQAIDYCAIINNDNLINIDEIQGMEVLHTMYILDNDALPSLPVMPDLRQIKSLHITNNSNLQSIGTFLKNVDQSVYEIIINNNSSLVSIGEWNGNVLYGTIWIENNPLLDVFPVIADSPEIEHLIIEDNDAITVLDLDTYNITGFLSIAGNDNLTTIAGLNGSDELIATVFIEDNPVLTDLSAFTSITMFDPRCFVYTYDPDELGDQEEYIPGGLVVSNNDALSDFSPFANMNFVNGGLYIEDNDVLQSLGVLPHISRLTDLKIVNNASLTNIDGFSNLTEIDFSLNVLGNNALENLNGLSALETINLDGPYTNYECPYLGSIIVSNNPVLNNADALFNITFINSYVELDMEDNYLLSNNETILNYLEDIRGLYRKKYCDVN